VKKPAVNMAEASAASDGGVATDLGDPHTPTVPKLAKSVTVTRWESEKIATAAQILIHPFRVHQNIIVLAKRSHETGAAMKALRQNNRLILPQSFARPAKNAFLVAFDIDLDQMNRRCPATFAIDRNNRDYQRFATHTPMLLTKRCLRSLESGAGTRKIVNRKLRRAHAIGYSNGTQRSVWNPVGPNRPLDKLNVSGVRLKQAKFEAGILSF